jgi:hypothetical protein
MIATTIDLAALPTHPLGDHLTPIDEPHWHESVQEHGYL